MKKIILIVSIIYLGSIAVFAQNLSLRTSSGPINNGDTITITDTNSHASLISYMWVTNNSSQNISVRVKKVELDVVPGTENYFCWTLCYQPSQYIGDTLIMKAGSTDKSHFSADYDAYGNAGKTRIRYVFYDDNNPTDSVCYVAEFYAGSGVGIADNKPIEANAKVFPNPAKNTLNLDYSLSKKNANVTFEIRNILGSVVLKTQLNAKNGQEKLDISHLNNGVYFYAIRSDNNVLLSNKLVVRK